MVTVPIKFKPKAGSSYTITIGATDRYGGVESPMPVVALASAGTPSTAG